MKATAKQYAQALYDSVDSKSEKATKEVVENFFSLLVKDNKTSNIEKIIEEFVTIWNKNNNILEVDLTTAKPLDKETRSMVENFLKRDSSASKININENIDKKILGGFIIRKGDKIFDNSLETKILNLKLGMQK